MSTKKSIFIQNATTLDCAVLLPNMTPKGFSWNVDIFWEGYLDKDGVVLDFSKAKRAAKTVIDKVFDHKLVAASSLVSKKDDRIITTSSYQFEGTDSIFIMDSYPDAVESIEDKHIIGIKNDDYNRFEQYIANKVISESPETIMSIRIKLTLHENHNEPYFFSYLHSLRNHYGNCQRFHGHSNIVQINKGSKFDHELSSCVAKFLSDKYLVSSSYIKNIHSFKNISNMIPDVIREPHVGIRYKGSQGFVELIIAEKQLLVCEDESTIENISTYIKKWFDIQEGDEVICYEGLAKGAVG